MSPHLPVDFVPGAPLQAPLHLAVRLRLAQAKIVVVIVVSLRNNNQKCRKPVYDNPPSETRQKPRARLLTWLKAAPLLRFLCDISRLLRGGQSRTGSSCYRPVPIAPSLSPTLSQPRTPEPGASRSRQSDPEAPLPAAAPPPLPAPLTGGRLLPAHARRLRARPASLLALLSPPRPFPLATPRRPSPPPAAIGREALATPPSPAACR